MRDLPRGTQVADHGGRSLSPTGLSPTMACRSRAVRLAIDLVTPPGPRRVPMIDSYNPTPETAAAYHAGLVWAIPVSLATTKGMISFPPATEMFQFAGLPPPGLFGSARSDWALPQPGFPIRTSPDHCLLATPRSFSQPATSFIGSWRQGIHPVPFVA